MDEDLPLLNRIFDSHISEIKCRVCSAMIDISQKREYSVVTCSQCNEKTPIRNAPPGKMYVRCQCHYLMLCERSSERVQCPRENCKEIILVQIPEVFPEPILYRLICVHCHESFFDELIEPLVTCTRCYKVSATNKKFIKNRSNSFLTLGILFLAIGITILWIIYAFVYAPYRIVLVSISMLLISAFLFSRALYYRRMKLSFDGEII